TDTHNIAAFLSKSDASEVKKVNDDVQLRALINGKKVVVSEAIIRRDLHLDDVDEVECFLNAESFEELTIMRYEKPPPKLTFYKAFFSVHWKFLIHTLVQCLSVKRTAWNKFSCFMASVVICLATVVMDHQVDDMTTHNTRYTSPALTQKKVADLEKDKHSQALEILQLKKRVKKLERKKKSKSSGFKRLRRVGTTQRGNPLLILFWVLRRMHPNRGKIAAIDADAGITLVDVEIDKEVVAMDVETRERLNQEDVSAVEPTVFNDEDVVMTMAQTLIKLKVEKAKLLDEHIAQKLHDEEVQKAAARDKQEKADMERALELQK
nr:hypothetical protein [Tanacetum cinerariifolium]